MSADDAKFAELRESFLRHLPRRAESAARRVHRFAEAGWDINGLSLLHDDIQRLAVASHRYGLEAVGDQLMVIEARLAYPLTRAVLPDAETGRLLREAFEMLAAVLPEPLPERAAAVPVHGDPERAETPPPGSWPAWSADAEAQASAEAEASAYLDARDAATAAIPLEEAVAFADAPLPEPEPAAAPPMPAPAAPSAAPAPPPRGPAPPIRPATAPAAGAPRGARPPQRIYHLTDAGELSIELDQRLETAGFEVELLMDAEELHELLQALPPDLVLVDPGFLDALESLGEVLRSTRQRAGKPVPLVAIAQRDDVALRLSARRAGADALLISPPGAADVLKRLQDLLDPSAEAPYRILIVEDDRAQALFAESVLRNAAMEAMVVSEPLDVLPTMESFQPDLVLMDLHMPQANGMELTALIREREAFLNTPIVFLSGEADPDKQFEALDAGGDDFLAKPVRPRHLISAVQNRVRRARAAALRQGGGRPARDAATGLYDRAWVLDRLNTLVDQREARGAVAFIELEGIAPMRERLGIGAVEQLLGAVGARFAGQLGEHPVARFGDASYLAVIAGEADAEIESIAQALRAALAVEAFEVGGMPVRLRASVGLVPLGLVFSDAGALLNAAERAARDARASERGVVRYEPPKRPEEAREAEMVQRIRDAIAGTGFELLYQPIVAVAGGEDAQYQCLLRLRGDDGRLFPAGEIIPIAERAGLIHEVDRWVVRAAIQQIVSAASTGTTLRLFVTQASKTVAHPGQVEWLRQQLDERGVAGSQLVIEVRLEDALVHSASVGQFFEALVPQGVQCCLGQFEAGVDADPLVERLPLSYVKLAYKYAGNEGVRDELRMLIDRCHRRNVMVIGHRVENAQSAASLWMSGIDFIQGNLVQQAASGLDFDFQSAVL